jgi:ribosomal protein S20
MNNIKQLKKSFNSIEKGYLPLLNHEARTSIKCGNKEFYTTIKNFKKASKKSKTRYQTNYKTLSHNVRFGLLKAFNIHLEIVYEKPQPTASELARRHNLNYKTTYHFKQKVIKDFGFTDLESY